MYVYDEHDHKIIQERVAQFRDQTNRYLAGELKDEEFLPLRLQNGLYIQRLAPMLRIAVPYGLLSATQVRKLAHISRVYDKGYCHMTTRQNVQFNWPNLEDVPDILAELAEVEMHAVQTSGNCIRNVTSDQFAGVATDEIVDPRPYCEIIRQWSTFHPEFAFLPRKFKIAVSGSVDDRAAIHFHDIGLQIVKSENGSVGFKVLVGGGLGRTPVIGSVIREFLAENDLLTYLEAILRVYNLHGRRDNKYKARIKILVKAMGPEEFAKRVEAEWEHIRDSQTLLTDKEIKRAKSFFTAPDYEAIDVQAAEAELANAASENKAFSNWLARNVTAHKVDGYKAVTLSLKPTGIAPGDVTDKQLEIIADLADKYSFGELRATHEQNIVLADVKVSELFNLWQEAKAAGFATANIGTLTDIICCPGGDFCSLANAKSIPIAEAIQREFDDLDYLYDLGDLDLNISGCMNACGHHHIGHIGILGVDKKGAEFYQVQLGGNAGNNAALAKVLGPAFSAEDMPTVVRKLVDVFVEKRVEGEQFFETYNRVGIEPFKERIYAKAS
ncbi:nitrite/sulfite reductase [Saccharophagus degradans]|uniref:Nitrite/sulfite reductase, hemoprotein beta-component, ferrodoxin-like protein n=1 Tax=Saccharophagus degradans (strain 2-40 / ATCC 43961 / DSM 17024) TaxID=203122 RepID=Q21J56_SACD2|nr:nitrite/sulfite reductase [Saccharophagus degradans]ABD81273.1 nitrite/sulfite reductase, hemoprotein beta-component, ferrodoxin-like protein [Saccharophagus degradans 2-40]